MIDLPQLPDLDRLFASFDPEIAKLTMDLRKAVHEVVPNVQEKVSFGWLGITLATADVGFFGGIFLTKQMVKLGFDFGPRLQDPEGLLDRSRKRVHYVMLQPGDTIPKSGLVPLLLQATDPGVIRDKRKS